VKSFEGTGGSRRGCIRWGVAGADESGARRAVRNGGVPDHSEWHSYGRRAKASEKAR